MDNETGATLAPPGKEFERQLPSLPPLPDLTDEQLAERRREFAAATAEVRAREAANRANIALAFDTASGDDRDRLFAAVRERLAHRDDPYMVARMRAGHRLDQVAAEIVGDEAAAEYARQRVAECDELMAKYPRKPVRGAMQELARLIAGMPNPAGETRIVLKSAPRVPRARPHSSPSATRRFLTTVVSNADGGSEPSSADGGDPEPGARAAGVTASCPSASDTYSTAAIVRLDASVRELTEQLRQTQQIAAARRWRERHQGSSSNSPPGPGRDLGVPVDPGDAPHPASPGRRLAIVSDRKAS